MRRLLLSPLFVLSLAGIAAEPPRIDTPVAGWSVGSDREAYRQRVDYPASSVNTPAGQPDAARIRGLITATGKGPARLIVNGTAMPLAIADDGGFDRPYAFAPGSNSIEVRDADGGVGRRQFYRSGTGAPAPRLRVLLAWDTDQTDLDLHVLSPDGGHAWYGAPVLDNGGALDVDVTTGYGPEIFSAPSPPAGTWFVYVNYYGGGWSESDDGALDAAEPLTTATITVVFNEGTPDERQQRFVVPMRQPGELTEVARFVWP